MSTTTPPQLALTGIFAAPRALVYQAFTDPDHLAAWWGRRAVRCRATRSSPTCAPGGHE